MARNIKRKMIHKELRNIGLITKLFTLRPSVKRFKRSRKLQEKFLLGKNLTKELKYQQIYVNDVRVAVYEPLNRNEKTVGVLWLHGGGYINGIPESEVEYFKRFIFPSNAIVFAPDYTKSFDAPYPKALNECYDVLKYMVEKAEEYNINTSQIFVAGVSAGGGLTAALTLYARDKGEVNIAFQMPLYPMLDDRFTKTNKDNDAPMWDSRCNKIAWKEYLRDLYQTDDVPIYAAPNRATDLSNLPPTLSFIGGVDPFRAETEEYIEKLIKAGVEVNFKVFEGCYHAFEVVGFWKKIAKEASSFSVEGFEYAVKNYYKEQPK